VAWDIARTEARLLTAATAEFSEHGFSGARIERISTRAGINRERIYSYFGNKQKLFEAVLTRVLESALDDVPIDGAGAAAIGDFAGRYFDAAVANPALARLVMWESLELGGAVNVIARSQRAQAKVVAIRDAHPALTADEARSLFFTIVALVHTWLQAPNLREIILADADDHTTGRAWVVQSATRLASRT
jgi:AcrR family transcriptional regulator